MSAPLPLNESRGSSLIVGQWTTVSIASILVILRIYARAFLRKIAGADDWTIVIALAFALAQSILTIFQVENGVGRHVEYVPPPQIRSVLLLTTVVEILHTIGTFLVRVSVCLFVLRLVPPTHREFYIYTYILIAFFAVISVATVLLILLGCIPIRGTWDRAVEARCIPRGGLSVIAKTQGAISALMDLLCVGLPIFFLRNLQAKWGRKVSLFGLLGLGVFTAACAILRTLAIDFENDDLTWQSARVAFWALLEQNLGIIVACLPALHHLYTYTLRKLLHGSNNNGSGTGDSYPRMRSLKPYIGDANASGEKMCGGGRRSRSDADGGRGGGGEAAAILPGPPSPTKKEPRLDYDCATLESSPKLEQAVTQEELSYLR